MIWVRVIFTVIIIIIRIVIFIAIALVLLTRSTWVMKVHASIKQKNPTVTNVDSRHQRTQQLPAQSACFTLKYVIT